jgi:hypothetical protein
MPECACVCIAPQRQEVSVPQIDGQPDHAAPEPVQYRTDGLSPKMIAAGVWAFLAPLLMAGGDALLGYLLDHPAVFAALPELVQVPILAILAALAASVAAAKARPGKVVPDVRS